MSTNAKDNSDTETLQRQAWVWLRTLNSGDLKAWEARGFKRWLRQSPAHRAAFDVAKQRWQMLRPLAGEMIRGDAQVARRHARLLQPVSPGRRKVLGAVAGVAVAGAAAAVVWNPPDGLWAAPREWRADVRTATGEQRAIRLTQATVTLNTRTSIRQRQDGSEGGIDLIAGEAAVDLSGSGVFTVTAGVAQSQAEAGRFEIRYLDGAACVTCLEGAVRVVHPLGTRLLRARQQARYTAAAIDAAAPVLPAAVSAWRQGQLVFSDTPLQAVLHEIDRYRRGRVVLLNDSVRDKTVTGSFYIAALDRALSQLQHTFQLHARSLPGGVLILS